MSAKRILLLILGLGLIGAAVGIALWNKPHENMASSKAEASVEAALLFKEYNTDETNANAKYLGNTIAVTGTVKELTKPADGPAKVTLETGDEFAVICELDALSQHARTDFQVGETVTFKGKCDGLNLDVQISRCVEIVK
ncbi:MAG: OB-fold protein [Saprospiraceae bacterium]